MLRVWLSIIRISQLNLFSCDACPVLRAIPLSDMVGLLSKGVAGMMGMCGYVSTGPADKQNGTCFPDSRTPRVLLALRKESHECHVQI